MNLLKPLEEKTFLALLSAFASRLEAREEAIAAYLAKKPSTVPELVAHGFLYPKHAQDLWVAEAEARTTQQHLESLARAGRALNEGGRWRMRA